MMLSACSGGPQRPNPDRINADREAFSGRSEVPLPKMTPAPLIEETLKISGRTIAISFEAPSEPGTYPLLVYLPGLGQSAHAGSLWRESWVQSGFAVLTVQSDHNAHALKTLSREDRMDLRTVGRPYFSEKELQLRLEDFEAGLEYLKKKSVSGTAPFNQARTHDIAVGGFDLGAQTLQALLGEKRKGIHLPESAGEIRAAILLSPHVDVAQGGIHQRFREISTPLLVITGTQDQDPWGMTSPSVRLAPFQQAASKRKILLNLTEASHQQMAGTDPSSQSPEDRESDPEQIQGQEEQDESFTRIKNRLSGTAAPPSPHQPPGNIKDPHHPGQQLSAIQWISSAFLSEILKKNPESEAWLKKKAASWLSAAGTLQNR